MNRAVNGQNDGHIMPEEAEAVSVELCAELAPFNFLDESSHHSQSLTQNDDLSIHPSSMEPHVHINDPRARLPLDQTVATTIENTPEQQTQSRQISTGLMIVDTPDNSMSVSPHRLSAQDLGPMRVYLDQAKLYCQQQEWQNAIDVCREILSIVPNHAEAYKLWGNVLQHSGNEIAAMGCYAKALLAEPNYPEVYANLGSIYAKQEQWKEAVTYYQHALALNPRFAGAYRNLSKVWKKLGKPERSTQYLVYALTLDSTLGTAEEFFRLGNYLAEKDKRNEAIHFYQITLKHQPDHLLACTRLAELLEQRGDWKLAVQYYRQILEIRAKENIKSSPKKRSTSNSRSIQRRKYTPSKTDYNQQSSDASGSHHHTIQSLTQAALSQPDSSQLRLQLGDMHAQNKDWTQAVDAYTSALRINPNLEKAYMKLGTSFSKLGKEQEMAESFHRAFEMDITLANARQHAKLGQIFLKQGELEKAITAFNRAIQRDPSYSDAHRQLGDALKLRGDQTAAMQAYQKASEIQSGVPHEKKLLASPQPLN